MGLIDEKDCPIGIFTTEGYNSNGPSSPVRTSTIRFTGSTDFSTKPKPKSLLPQESFFFTVIRTYAFLLGFICRPLYMLIMFAYCNFSPHLLLLLSGILLVFNMLPIALSLHFDSMGGMIFAIALEISSIIFTGMLLGNLLNDLFHYHHLEHPENSTGHYNTLERYHVDDLIPLTCTLFFSLFFQLIFFLVLFRWLCGYSLFPQRPKLGPYRIYRKVEKFLCFLTMVIMLVITCLVIVHVFNIEICGYGEKCERLGFLYANEDDPRLLAAYSNQDRNRAIKTIMSYMTLGSIDIPFDELPLRSGLGFREDKINYKVLGDYSKIHRRSVPVGPVF